MALRTTEDSDTKLNPGQADADREFNGRKPSGIAAAEEAGTFDDSDNSDKDSSNNTRGMSSANKVKDAEENPSADYVNNVTGKNNSPIKVGGKLNILKKKGPMGAILGILVGGIGISSLLSPGILLVQMKESLVDRFNTQLTSMDYRTSKVLSAKISGTTSGVCTNAVSIRCKFSSMSDKQVSRFKAAGIEIEPKAGTTITGRTRPNTFKFNGETIAPNEFNSRFTKDPKFRSAIKQAYNPKYAGFSDNVWKKTATRLGINKSKALPEGDATEKAAAIDEKTKNGFGADDLADGIDCPEGGGVCTKTNEDGTKTQLDEAASEDARATKAATADALDQAAESTERSAANTIENSSLDAIERGGVGATLTTLKNTASITGGVDIACSVYSAVRGLGYAAKTVRAVQLARYAMVFLNTADQIKAGTATPEDVAYLGGIITSVAYDANAAVNRKAGMDSFGMKYAMYGEVGKADSYVSQFMAGGGLTGDLINATNLINSTLGGNPRTLCKANSSVWAQIGGVAAGLALVIIPGGQIAVGAADVAKGLLAITALVAVSMIPSLLKDIVAGTVTKDIVGEDSTNAVTSGAGIIMSQTAQAGGNAAMSVEDAVAYNSAQNEVLAQYAEEDRANLSPLDVSSKNTFLGSIVSNLLPSISKMSSISGSLSSIGSIIGKSFSSIIPTSSALSQEQLNTAYKSCTDPDYAQMEIATDPFCNPVLGIPPQYLNKDTLDIIDELVAEGSIDESGAVISGSKYSNYLKNCINRTEPLGSGGSDDLGNTGSECKIDANNANYYLYTIDQRINTGMDGYDTEPVVSEIPDTIPPSSTAGGSIDQGQLFVDSTTVACAPGTLDAGVAVGYHSGAPVNIRLCSLPNTTDGNNRNQPIRVNSRVSGAFLALTTAMAQGLGRTSLHVADSFRTMAGQQAAFARYGSPRAARPGFSNHQMGLAIDFQLATGNNGAVKAPGRDSVYDWLAANAGSYGIGKYSREAWHWQPVGVN